MNSIFREARALREAVRFFTRVPLSSAPSFPEETRWAMTYFPLVGWFVAGTAAGVFWLSSRLWPMAIASGVSLLATIVFTGALHEDGLADVCDSLGAGQDRSRALAIMKDSRIGVFGAVGLGLVLALKWQLIASGAEVGMAGKGVRDALGALWCGHALSRGVVCGVPMALPYLDSTGSKSRPLVAPLSGLRTAAAACFAVAPCLICGALGVFAWARLAIALVVVCSFTFALGAWFSKRLGGYTGDCLGAVQQLTELAFYFVVFAAGS